MQHNNSLLSPILFSILLALSLRPRHGYELRQQIAKDSDGLLALGASSLYGALRQLQEANVIEEMPHEGNPRRKYYRLTQKGWNQLADNAPFYANAAHLIEERHI